jgi:hypothetical protein
LFLLIRREHPQILDGIITSENQGTTSEGGVEGKSSSYCLIIDR